MENLENLKARAAGQKKANKKFLTQLKRRNTREIDKVIHQAHSEVFSKINCLNCANCCKTTGPLFTEKDIERIARHLGLKIQSFIEKYLRIDEDNDHVLKTVPCSFLDDENYCSIYEVRPKACREYPHTDRVKQHQLFNLTLKNTSICPGVYEIIEKIKKDT